MKKDTIITLLIVLAIIIFSLIILNKPAPEVSEELARCIGSKSVLYVELGCPFCEEQKKMFGENKKYLNIIDCFYEAEKCSEIKGIPTWIINNQQYRGVQSIEDLREATGC